jgi:ABC-type branched-subunit amino acid transport system ATPase component
VTQRDGVTVVLAEQKVELATTVADSVAFLEAGAVRPAEPAHDR